MVISGDEVMFSDLMNSQFEVASDCDSSGSCTLPETQHLQVKVITPFKTSVIVFSRRAINDGMIFGICS